MRRYVAALLALPALAACDPRAHDSPGQATPPADASVEAAPAATKPDISPEFGASFRLIGTEPFWAVRVGQRTLVLSRPGQADLTVGHSGPVGRDGHATWSGPGLSATVDKQACSDGMSDRAYHYNAEVRVGALTLKGCGDSEAWFAP